MYNSIALFFIRTIYKNIKYCKKHLYFTWFPGVEILRKGAISI